LSWNTKTTLLYLYQAIACFELQKPVHEKLLKLSAELATRIATEHPGISPKELGVEIAVCWAGKTSDIQTYWTSLIIERVDGLIAA
jgi:hypothetical protein